MQRETLVPTIVEGTSLSVINFQDLVNNAQTSLDGRARAIALTLLEAAISAVDPKLLVKNAVRLQGHKLRVKNLTVDLTGYDRILAVGGGKASGGLAEALEELLGNRLDSGMINVPRGTAERFRTRVIQVNEAGHPIPDHGGVEGANKIMEMLKGLDERTLVITLLSGGGSALLPLPQEGISLEDKQETTNLLLTCGATIEEINVVRKHISRLKGGRLAAYAFPATVLCLLVSDVVGDALPSIASGPTVPDPSTFTEAVETLRRYNIWERIPDAVKEYLRGGVMGENPESPKPGDVRFSQVHNVLLGNGEVALEASERRAKELGLNSLILSSYMEGEARHVGTVLSALAREMIVTNRPLATPGVVLAGGETTVTVTGTGRGGRNQETVLGAALHLVKTHGVAIASMGTDGVDGSSDAAGAIIDGSTMTRALTRGIEPIHFLKNNDSYHFFRELNDLIFTGFTGTNVGDIMVIVVLDEKDDVEKLS